MAIPTVREAGTEAHRGAPSGPLHTEVQHNDVRNPSKSAPEVDDD